MIATIVDSGNLICMDAPDEVSFAAVREAVAKAGFDQRYAREMAKRDAFSRAARELSKERIIRKVDENDTEIRFQFTREFLQDSSFCYEKECDMYLDKHTGLVRSDCEELAKEAQRLVDEHQAKRKSRDITRMIQRIFDDRRGDLISFRKGGGVYFVPDTHRNLVDSVDVLLSTLGGSLQRAYIPKVSNDEGTSRTIARKLKDHLNGMISEFRTSCETITTDTSDAVLERRVAAVAEMRDKLQSYQALLSEYADSIASEIDKAESDLVAVITAAA